MSEHLRHLSERESLSLDRDKEVEERTFKDIVQVLGRSQSDPPDGSELQHLSGQI